MFPKSNRFVTGFRRFRGFITMPCLLILMGTGCTSVTKIDEIEPNNTTGTATLLRPYEFGEGDISPIGDKDVWRVPNVAAGSLVFAYVDTNASMDSKDSFLRMLDATGV